MIQGYQMHDNARSGSPAVSRPGRARLSPRSARHMALLAELDAHTFTSDVAGVPWRRSLDWPGGPMEAA